MLDALGDDYIAQHVMQAYRDYLEQTSYRVYMSNMVNGIAAILSGSEPETKWSDILNDLDSATAPNAKEQQESEAEIKSKILEKLNGKGES
jgi:hypothetical protein